MKPDLDLPEIAKAVALSFSLLAAPVAKDYAVLDTIAPAKDFGSRWQRRQR